MDGSTIKTPRPRDVWGRRVSYEGVKPWCVFGGYRMAAVSWTRDEDGWDQDHDFSDLPATVFPTEAECLAAINALAASRQSEAA